MGSPCGSSLPIHIIRESSRPRCVFASGAVLCIIVRRGASRSARFSISKSFKGGRAHLSRKKQTSIQKREAKRLPYGPKISLFSGCRGASPYRLIRKQTNDGRGRRPRRPICEYHFLWTGAHTAPLRVCAHSIIYVSPLSRLASSPKRHGAKVIR